ncbi:MAG: EamA family transporter [Pseudomonadota bacterium]
MTWILLALAAGSFQACRNAVARSVAGKFSPMLNSWSRFAFNLPFSILLVAWFIAQYDWPALNANYLFWCAMIGVMQILGNVALIEAFRRSSFAQSMVFHKLEVVMAAIIGVMIFSEYPTLFGWLGVLICAVGVILMNLGREIAGMNAWRRAFTLDSGGTFALLCGLLLVFASFSIKEAADAFVAINPNTSPDRLEAAVHTLFHTTWMEVVILTVAILIRSPGEFKHVRQYWPRMSIIGFTGFCGSFCWFWAYSIALVTYVKAVGLIEAPIAVLISLLLWKEREVIKQLPGIFVLLSGILVVLIFG